MSVDFDEGNIVYKETITNTVEGIGHFEPLRHYAEVHLLLEPGEEGSGMQFASACSEDVLDRNWQRLILTHLEEREHKGCARSSDHGYEDHTADRTGTYQTYRGRGFPSGDVSCRKTGTSQGKKVSYWNRIMSSGWKSFGAGRTKHDRYPEDARRI